MLVLILACTSSVRLDGPAHPTRDTGVPRIDTAADTDVETADTAADTDVETGASATVEDLVVEELDTAVVVTATLTARSALDVMIGDVAAHYDVDDLTWSGTSTTITRAIDDCADRGSTWLVQVATSDDTATSAITVSGTSIALVEDGDTSADATDLGDLALGSTYVCGDIDAATGVSTYSGSDLDWTTFGLPDGGVVHLELTWSEAAADYDLVVARLDTAQLANATDHTGAQPETVDLVLDAGSYYAWVGGWSEPVGAYAVRIDVSAM